MKKKKKSPTINITLEENLKKALTELLLLHLLNIREYYIGELTQTLSDRSNGALRLVFPYSALYRLQQEGHITESEKRISSDGRRRQYYHITDQGREYYRNLMDSYRNFISSVETVLDQEL